MRDPLNIQFEPDAFSRLDETDDRRFHETERAVEQPDETARAIMERIIDTLAVEEAPAILDHMAGRNSHLPPKLKPARVVGLGLDSDELERNPALTESVIHDLNRDPVLPFADSTFDLVLNTLSVSYITRPVAVFREAARILKPGGLFLVIFSNRALEEKTVKIWRESSETVRVDLVNVYFERSGMFESRASFASIGKRRSGEWRSGGRGLPSDPIYAVYADRQSAGRSHRPRPQVPPEHVELPDSETIEHRKRLAHWTLRCPYCDELLTEWEVPDTPFNQWDADCVYVCLNASCSHTIRSRSAMHAQGNVGLTCRLMYHRERDCFYNVPDLAFGGRD